MLFLTETDMVINRQDDYRLPGFNTIFQKRETENGKVRIVALIEESVESQITVKENLMSTNFPSIWLELKSKHAVPVAICGIYRQWSHNVIYKSQYYSIHSTNTIPWGGGGDTSA